LLFGSSGENSTNIDRILSSCNDVGYRTRRRSLVPYQFFVSLEGDSFLISAPLTVTAPFLDARARHGAWRKQRVYRQRPRALRGIAFAPPLSQKEKTMRVILLWLLGVPLSVLILLMLFGVL
jgi:hypothetical protein